jgi:hypothetical protein
MFRDHGRRELGLSVVESLEDRVELVSLFFRVSLAYSSLGLRLGVHGTFWFSISAEISPTATPFRFSSALFVTLDIF